MRYYLATNEIDVFHYGSIETNQSLETGQPKLTYFTTKQQLINALASYGQTYQEPTTEIIYQNEDELPQPPPPPEGEPPVEPEI